MKCYKNKIKNKQKYNNKINKYYYNYKNKNVRNECVYNVYVYIFLILLFFYT